ncbi:hypothetical protein BC829DRAFT_363249, partial [Chytridium lagenaria]
KIHVEEDMDKLNDANKHQLGIRVQSLNWDGLDCPKLRPESLCRYSGSFVGQDFKVVCQIAPFIFFQHC